MGLYARFILPNLVHTMCSIKAAAEQRAKVVPFARGNVLEVGFGSGLNLPFFDPAKVQQVWALDPSRELWAKAEKEAKRASFPVQFLNALAEEIPLPDQSADTVLVTYSLCTIPGIPRALAEIARVLKPDGELIFCEHGLAPDRNIQGWQNRLNPVWKKIGGGCNLNRAVPPLLETGGFRLTELHSMYTPISKLVGFNYWGRAAVK